MANASSSKLTQAQTSPRHAPKRRLKKSSRTARRSTVSVRKLSPVRRRDLDGSRRSKPSVNKLKQGRKALLANDKELISQILSDDRLRLSIREANGAVRFPTSVWTDCDQTWDHTKIASYDLPAWGRLSELMKMFVAFDYGLEKGWCFPFTVNIASEYVNRWESDGSGFIQNINQRIRRELQYAGLDGLPFCLVVETRTKSGKSRCRPHLHGFAICDDPIKATKLKMAFENAFASHLPARRRQRAVKIERAYSAGDPVMGRFRWVSYMTKNVDYYDERLGRRRVFMNHPFLAFAREGWAIRREEF